ncbi:MAG: aminotransferase class III-fold pyridoxal phosphate-dependent enzyme, partial [Proteobacteria bacterium]|nr:aminotransferase class III-fold pyridoxal phosphate-dependent enzyme [Pseudomonadota bacterium]
SNLYNIPNQEQLAEILVQLTDMERAFFCNSGAEANEAALKIARLYGHQQGCEKPTVIVTKGSFHGRTLATLSATGNPKVQQGFEPLVEGFVRVPYNDIEAIAKLSTNSQIVAVLVEPVIGEGGILIPADDYLVKLHNLCKQNNWLLMLDEIQTGMGRTGKWCAFQHTNILPDVITLAKGLGNGVPIGACLTRDKVADILQPGTHGSTFGGNPLVCKVALAVINTIKQDNLLLRVQELSERFKQGFNKNLANVSGVKEIRIKGLMIGIELEQACSQLVIKALAQNLLINVTAERVIRLLPPFILTNEQADEIIVTVSNLVKEELG